MNKYMLLTGICYALSTPIGVHIGYLMGQGSWTQVFAELALLVVIHMSAPVFWVKAQTLDLKMQKDEPNRK